VGVSVTEGKRHADALFPLTLPIPTPRLGGSSLVMWATAALWLLEEGLASVKTPSALAADRSRTAPRRRERSEAPLPPRLPPPLHPSVVVVVVVVVLPGEGREGGAQRFETGNDEQVHRY